MSILQETDASSSGMESAMLHKAHTPGVLLLSKITGWYGKYSGYYEQVPRHICALDPESLVVRPRNSRVARGVGKIYTKIRKLPPRDQSLTFAELETRFLATISRKKLIHILNVEEHIPFVSDAAKSGRKIIGTIHLPPSVWETGDADALRRLSAAIVLYRKDMAYFESYVGNGRVEFIRHGVDTDFFSPPEKRVFGDCPRLLFTGQYLRNTAMLKRVITSLAAKHHQLRFDLVVPKHAAGNPDFLSLRSNNAVCWHEGVSDEDLRNFYRNATLMLLPMNDSGANNAVVEALASGLPVATTNVGGISDYGGGTIFPVVENDDDSALIDLVERYLEEHEWREAISKRQREFAETELKWQDIARQHLSTYVRILEMTH